MKIEINNRANYKINLKLVKNLAAEFARVYKVKEKNLSLAFISDQEIKAINQTYRGLDQATDVLSFEGEGEDLGEVIIDYDQIKRQAEEFKHSAEEELIFILVHGLLHLLGYNDETEPDRLKMIKLGEEFIKKYPPS